MIPLIFQVFASQNVTGWGELIDGNIIGSAFVMFDTAWAGWVVAILFILYQFMLYLKTRSVVLAWISGIFFISMYVTSSLVKSISVQIMFILLVFEMAGIVFMLLFK